MAKKKIAALASVKRHVETVANKKKKKKRLNTRNELFTRSSFNLFIITGVNSKPAISNNQIVKRVALSHNPMKKKNVRMIKCEMHFIYVTCNFSHETCSLVRSISINQMFKYVFFFFLVFFLVSCRRPRSFLIHLRYRFPSVLGRSKYYISFFFLFFFWCFVRLLFIFDCFMSSRNAFGCDNHTKF